MENKIAFVIATKDRPRKLRRLIESLAAQSYRLSQVIIVDGGTKVLEGVTEDYRDLSIDYIKHSPPSAAKQHNVGIEALKPGLSRGELMLII